MTPPPQSGQKPDIDKTVTLLVTIFTSLLVIWGILQLAQHYYPIVALLGVVWIITYILLAPVDWVEKAIVFISRFIGQFPPVQWLRSHTPHANPRILAVLIVYFVFFMVVTLGTIQLVPVLNKQIGEFTRDFSRNVNSTSSILVDWSNAQLGSSLLKKIFRADIDQAEREGLVHHPTGSEDTPITLEEKQVIQKSVVKTTVSRVTRFLEKTFHNWINQALGLITGTLTGLLYFLSGFLLVFYLLLDGPRLRQGFMSLLPESTRNTSRYFLENFHMVMFTFIKGQVLLGILTGLYMFIIFSVFNIPYAIFLSCFFGAAEILPVVGTYIGFIPVIAVILFSGSPLLILPVWACSYFYQTLKDNILAPKVVGEVMGLHPLVVILAILIGAQTAGLVGILLALPMASALNVVIRYFRELDPEHSSLHITAVMRDTSHGTSSNHTD